MRHAIVTYYKFSELDDKAKEKVIDNNRGINVDHEWYDYIFDDAKHMASLMGIEIDNIYFGGFSSQGDGACFTGSYSYKKGSVKAIKDEAPLDTELHRIATELFQLQRKHFYGLSASVVHRGHYNHSGCTSITVNHYVEGQGVDEDLTDILREFMDWIYDQLQKQYWFLVSDEAVQETIEINEYEFDENGDPA